MLVIKFHWGRELDVVRDDTGMFAFNAEGFMAMKSYENVFPKQEAFANAPMLLGIAKLSDKRLLYTFDQLTPEFLLSGIQGLSPVPYTMPIYTIIVKELGDKIAWSRGIEKIWYPEYT
jgi:hypothetical protein